MFARFGKHLLNCFGTLVYPLVHRHPAEYLAQQAPLRQAVRERPRRAQKLELDNRADGDHAGRELIRPGLAELLLQDPEQARGVNQVQGRAHLRYAALFPRNSSKSPRSASSPSGASARRRSSRCPTSRRAALTVSFLVLVPSTSAVVARASSSISMGVFTMAMSAPPRMLKIS